MCQIALSKSIEKVKKKYSSDSSDNSDSSEKKHATSAQKSNLTHLTTDVMFSGQRLRFSRCFLEDRLRDIICLEVAWFCVWRGFVIFLTHSLRFHDLFFWRLCNFFCREVAWFFVERLHELCVCEEVAWFFCVKRLPDFWWKIGFFTEKKRFLVKTSFFGHYCHYCQVVWFFLERFCDFVCGEVAWFLCVEKLCDFSHSVTQVVWLIFPEVAWFFLQRDCVIFLEWFFLWRGSMILFGGQVAWFHLLRGCMILCVDRLCDYSHSLIQVARFIFLEVV